MSCEAQAVELRESLIDEADRADTWNSVWRWGFTAAAVGSAAVAIADPVHEYRANLYVSAGKAAIAGFGRWIMPLHVEVPPPSGDACADVAAMHRAIARTAKSERGLFYSNHIGGIVLNAIGGLIVDHYSGAGQAAISAGGGYAVGLVATYTMPRDSWHDAIVVSVMPTHGGWFVGAAGSF